MMKKLLAGALVSCMLLGSTVAFAEETEVSVTELNWEDFVAINDAADEDIISQGDFVTFDEIACKMWVPDVMKEVELTDEDKDAGFIAYYSTEDGDAVASVVYADVKGMELEDYAKELEDMDGVENVEPVVINGLYAISYDMPEADTTCLSLATEAGYVLEFSFAPLSDENFQAIIAFMGASVQPEEEESTEAAS